MRKPNRLNVALVCLNVATLGMLVARGGGAAPANAALPDDAFLQPEKDGVKESPFNAGEQRKQIIAQLETANKKLAAIEKKLDGGLSVKVTEMPAVIVKDPSKK